MKYLFFAVFFMSFLLSSIHARETEVDSLLALLETSDNCTGQVELHNKIASIFIRNEKFRLAEIHVLQALQLLSGDTTSFSYAQSLLTLSGIYLRQELFTKAFKYSSSAAFIAQKQKFDHIYASALLNSAVILKESGKNDQAVEYARKSILANAETGDSLAVSYACNTLGMIEKNCGNFDQALAYYDTSLLLRIKFGTQHDRLIILGNIAILNMLQGRLDTALQYFGRVRKIAEETGSTYFKTSVFKSLGELMLLKGDTSLAFAYFDSCRVIAESNHYYETLRDVYKIISEVNYAQKRYEIAWEQKEKFLAIKDTVSAHDIAGSIEEWQMIYNSRNQQTQIDELKLKNAGNSYVIQLLIIVFLIILVVLIHLRFLRIKNAKQAIKASETKFKMLAENSAEVIWSCDLDLKLTYISPATQNLFGYERAERLKMHIKEIFSSESIQKMQSELQRILELNKKNKTEQKPLVIELKGLHKNGHEVWVEITADLVFDQINKPSGLQGLARDVTERKNAEFKMAEMVQHLNRQDHELKQHNQALIQAQKDIVKTAGQYYDLFENGPVGYLILNDQSIITQINSTASQMIGLSKDELLHKSFLQFIDDKEKPVFSDNLIKTITKNQIHQHVFQLAQITVKIVFVPHFADDIPKCRLVLADVTSEVLAKQELSLSLQSLQAVFAAIPIGIAVISKDFKIVNMNDRLRVMHKIDGQSEFSGKKCHDVFNCGLTPCADCIWMQVLKTQKTIVRNSSPDDNVYKDGFYRIYSSPIIDQQGNVTGIVEAVMDISNLIKAESALRESERKFEELFNDIPDAVLITDIGEHSGKIIDVNPAAEAQTGYTRQELLQMNVLYDISEDINRNELACDRELKLLDNQKVELTERKRKKDGSCIWTEVVVQKIVIGGKSLALSVSRDINERMEIQENLKKSESRIRTILNAFPDLLFVFDKDGYFVEYHNTANEKLILDPSQFLNKKVVDVMPKYLADLTMQKIESTFATGNMQLYEYSLDYPEGKQFFDVRMVVASENTVLTTVRNITETRRAEEDKKQNEEKYKTLFLNTPLGVFNFDENSVILNCNEKFEKIIGVGRNMLNGFNILQQTNDEAMKQAVSNSIKNGIGYYEASYKAVTSGKITPVKAFFKSVYDEKGNFVDGIGIVEDVTEQKKYEASLLDALKRAEQSDKLKSSFMATMSHELRTPLNTVIGFSDIIDDTMPIDQVMEFTSVISKSGRHLLSIIEDIIDISLIDSGESKMMVERFLLRDLIDGLEILTNQEKSNMGKDYLDFNISLPDSLIGIKLTGDFRKIKKVFAHLLKNALKFTRKGSVEFGISEKDLLTNQRDIVFYVKDSGIGIPIDKQDIIFEIFRQADDSSTREFEGTGLGLSISKKLIDMMGGKIWLESEPNKGSVFFVQLPVLASAADTIGIIHKNNTPLINTTKAAIALVAEDDDTNFHLFKLLLGRKKIEVIRAKNGKIAVEIVADNPNINLVLMDINMPVMNGFEATILIKKMRPDLPVIAVTAYAMATDKANAMEAGCDEYVTKPINNQILYEALAKFIC